MAADELIGRIPPELKAAACPDRWDELMVYLEDPDAASDAIHHHVNKCASCRGVIDWILKQQAATTRKQIAEKQAQQ